MASFYCDEDVAILVASALRQAGHAVQTTVGERRIGAWDADQLRYAIDQGCIVITHNRRDFHTLHDAWIQWSPRWRIRLLHGGILILDQVPASPIITAAIQTFLTTAPPSLAGQTYDWFARDGGTWKQWRS
jgi:hypothetical protein